MPTPCLPENMMLPAETRGYLTFRGDLSVLGRVSRGAGLRLKVVLFKILQEKLLDTKTWQLTGPQLNIATVGSLLPPGGPLSPDGRRLGGSGCKRDFAPCSLLPPPPGESGIR